jgi:hypothetical protein
MAWTTVPTFVSGNILTAAQMNGLGGDLNELRGDFAWAQRASTDLTLNSLNWANVDTAMDLVLAADAGDWVEVAASGLWGSENVTGYLDVVTMVGSTVTNSFAENGAVSASSGGITAWRIDGTAVRSFGGSYFYKLVAGDISSGNVTLRLRYRTGTATNKTLFSTTLARFVWFGRNHGPVEI